MVKPLIVARKDSGSQMVDSIPLIRVTQSTSGMRTPATATVGTTTKVMWMRMSTSSTQVNKKTTAAVVDSIEARMVCKNDDGFQEIEYVEKMIQNYPRSKNY